MNDDLAWAKSRAFFYPFALPDGTTTVCDGGESVVLLHETRRRMLHAALDEAFAEGEAAVVSALDVGCHQGWFTQQLARRFGDVIGVDVNKQSIDEAQRLRMICGPYPGAIRFEVRGWQALLDPDREPQTLPLNSYDLVVALGLVYHVSDLVRCLRTLARCARRALVIETQLVPDDDIRDAHGTIPWDVGGRKPVLGYCALVRDDANREGGDSELALVPSEAVLRAVLEREGMTVTRLPVPEDGHAVLKLGYRGMFLARRKG